MKGASNLILFSRARFSPSFVLLIQTPLDPMVACNPLTSNTRSFRPAPETNALRLCIISWSPNQTFEVFDYHTQDLVYVSAWTCHQSGLGMTWFASMHNIQTFTARSSLLMSWHAILGLTKRNNGSRNQDEQFRLAIPRQSPTSSWSFFCASRSLEHRVSSTH